MVTGCVRTLRVVPSIPILVAIASTNAQTRDPSSPTESVTAPVTDPGALHPIITEILFAVPTDDGTGRGDANQDGSREVAGDEFVEIANPHDKPISLKGYVLRDSAPSGPSRFEFEFPDMTLEPGGCAVVFNGRNARWDGPVGDTSRAPEASHPLFYDAHLFTARCSAQVTFANAGDWVMLKSPDGERIQCVSWGSPKASLPDGVATTEGMGRVAGMSVQRDALTGTFSKHADLDGRLYSPGEPFVEKLQPETESDPDVQPSSPDKEAI